jgi:hypothetical protein
VRHSKLKSGTKENVAIEKRRAEVSELYMKTSLSMREIGLQYGVTYGTIYNDLRAIREDWRTKATDNIEKKKAMELGRVDMIEVEAWKAWERSVGTTTKTTTTKRGKDVTVSVVVDTQSGDARYLDQIHKCVEQRRRILGLDEPNRSTIEDPDGGPVAFRIEGLEGAAWLPQQLTSPNQGREPDNSD